MGNPLGPFEFKECISLVKSTGKKAKTLRELRDLIALVGDESVYYHTYHYYLRRQILEYNNDFAAQKLISQESGLIMLYPLSSTITPNI